jgi:hypothetical protein
MRKSWPTRGCRAKNKEKLTSVLKILRFTRLHTTSIIIDIEKAKIDSSLKISAEL